VSYPNKKKVSNLFLRIACERCQCGKNAIRDFDQRIILLRGGQSEHGGDASWREGVFHRSRKRRDENALSMSGINETPNFAHANRRIRSDPWLVIAAWTEQKITLKGR
jgi:hypothetical protein